MGEDVDAGGGDRGEEPCRLVLGAAELGVRRGQHELEHRDFLSRQIQVPVGADVRLDALDEAEPSVVRLVDAIDLRMLPDDVRHGNAVGDAQTVRVVGHANERIAAREAGGGELAERWARRRSIRCAPGGRPGTAGAGWGSRAVRQDARRPPRG